MYGESLVSNFYSEFGVRSNSFSFSLMSECRFKILKQSKIKQSNWFGWFTIKFHYGRGTSYCWPFGTPLIQGILLVPTELHCARVVPLCKKNDRLSAGSYRPVSILKKVIEKIVFDQINLYLKEKHLNYNFQSVFRSGYSTDTCLTH